MVGNSASPFEIPSRIETVLVPLDGSSFSEIALPVAARLAGRLGAGIHLFSVAPDDESAAQRTKELASLSVSGPRVAHEVVVDHDPAGAIHDALQRLQPAVACMASHGRGRSAALLGSVANEVIARGRDPLVLVGQLVDIDRTGSGVVLCVDETPASAALVPITLGWTKLLGEALTVVVVAEPVPEPTRPERGAHRLFGPEGDPQAYLDGLIAPFGDQELSATVVWDPISPVEGLVSFVDEHPASLVVVGSHARVGLARVVLGSVAAGVVAKSAVPVVVVPRPDLSA